MVDFTREFYTPLPRSNGRPSSYDSCTTDEGYHTDDKPNEQQHSSIENEIPILKSNRTMYVFLRVLSNIAY